MQNQYEHDENLAYVHSISNESLDSETLDESHIDAVEDYLDRVCAPLVGRLPRNKREEIRERVRQRLEQFTAAHRELGSSEAEAVEQALAQCGEPELISRRWLPDQHSAQNVHVTTGRTTQKLSDRLLGSARASTIVASVTFGAPFIAYIMQASRDMQANQEPNAIYYRVWLFAAPLIAGMLTGLAAKNKPARGVANVTALVTILGIAMSGLACCMAITKIGPDLAQSAAYSLAAGVCGIVPWLVLGCSGATLGHRVRKAGARIATRAGRVLRIRWPELFMNASKG